MYIEYKDFKLHNYIVFLVVNVSFFKKSFSSNQCYPNLALFIHILLLFGFFTSMLFVVADGVSLVTVAMESVGFFQT